MNALFDFNRYIGLTNPKVLSYHKGGETFEDYQDAYAFDPSRGRYAVADGVAGSYGAHVWAQILVNGFCNTDVTQLIQECQGIYGGEWLTSMQSEWLNAIVQIQSENIRSQHFSRTKGTNEHAAATFVGLETYKTSDGNLMWEAMLIGDTCLFHLNEKDELINTYSLTRSSEFTNHPECFLTVSQSDVFLKTEFVGPNLVNDGDMFIIATDAMAKWMLAQNESGNWPAMVQTLDRISFQSEFYDFINKLRRSDMDDDDVTLLVVPTRKRAVIHNLPSAMKVTEGVPQSQSLPRIQERENKAPEHSGSIQKNLSRDRWEMGKLASGRRTNYSQQSQEYKRSKKWIPKLQWKKLVTVTLLLIVLLQIITLVFNLYFIHLILHGQIRYPEL